MKAKQKDCPSISVCIPTYNSSKTLDRCLESIRAQKYPQDKIEILLGDGGSIDDTFKIAKKYKATVIKISSDKQHAEYNRGVAFNKAKNELVLIVDHDNFLPDEEWLVRMIQPLLDDWEVVASSTCYYDYSEKYDLMDRYFALFGTSEPLPFYLGKADRLQYGVQKWNLVGNSKDCGDYFSVTFENDPRKFPSIGSNGCLMRRELVKNNAKSDPDNHFPIDVMFDMVANGFNKFAFVKTSIIHLTHSQGLFKFLQRRVKFVLKYHFEDQGRRRWSVFMKGDELKLLLFVFYSLTIVKPLIDSIRGFVRIPDIAWFVHPIMCFGTTIVYGYASINQLLSKKKLGI